MKHFMRLFPDLFAIMFLFGLPSLWYRLTTGGYIFSSDTGMFFPFLLLIWLRLVMIYARQSRQGDNKEDRISDNPTQ